MLNKDQLREHFLAMWNREDFTHLKNDYASDYRGYDTSGLPSGDDAAAIERTVRMYRQGFPNLQMKVTHAIQDGNTVCLRWKCQGRHTGGLLGMKPTNKQIEVSGTSIYRLENNKVVEEFTNWDALSFLQQVGVVPEMKVPEQV